MIGSDTEPCGIGLVGTPPDAPLTENMFDE